MILKAIKWPGKLLPFFILFALVGCRPNDPLPTALPTEIPPLPSITVALPSPSPPTLTPVPVVARVNGEEITLQDFQSELERYRSAMGEVGMNMATDDEQYVLSDMIDQLLLAQAATESGFLVSQEILDSRLDQLVGELGGRQVLVEWMSAHGYTEDEFQRSLSKAIAAAWMRDNLVNAVPEQMEQVHARQILVFDAESAQDVLGRLAAGKDFEDLAYEFDPVLGGDLGWFPKGYLAQAALDEAVFSLQPGQTSAVIETELGFHILYLIEVADQRTLSPDAWLSMQVNALQSWLGERRSQSDIQYLLP